MTNTFLSKVRAERKVLSVINTLTPGTRQLTGLSSAAIEVWRQNAGIPAADRIANQLVDLAVLCQSLSDRSNESFNSLDPALHERIDEKVRELAATEGICAKMV